MKGRIFLIASCLFLLGLSLFAGDVDSKMQYGFRFGVVFNGFESTHTAANSPFLDETVEKKVGFLGGAFYDFRVYQGNPILLVTTGINYKMLRFKGNFVTEDTPAVLGSYNNLFHCVDFPVGLKAVLTHMNGRPFFGAGLQMDVIAVDSRTISNVPIEQYDTIPAYNSRFNLGPYFQAGFEVPTNSYYYCFEFRYIHWGKDNFTPNSCFFSRNKGEIQLTFGLKFR
jgi:hypothetical protein